MNRRKQWSSETRGMASQKVSSGVCFFEGAGLDFWAQAWLWLSRD